MLWFAVDLQAALAVSGVFTFGRFDITLLWKRKHSRCRPQAQFVKQHGCMYRILGYLVHPRNDNG